MGQRIFRADPGHRLGREEQERGPATAKTSSCPGKSARSCKVYEKNIPGRAARAAIATVLQAAGSSPAGGADRRGEPGAGQPERPRLARRWHAAALRGGGARRRPQAERQRAGPVRHRQPADAGRPARLRPGRRRAGDGARRSSAPRPTGSCIMALAHAHHLGRIGHFAEMAVAQGLVSLHFVNVQSRPVVAPFGGADGRYGTNPCCIGIPLDGREPFVLDFATSRVAQGKMRVAHNEGRRVEPGLPDRRTRPAHHQPGRGGGAATERPVRRPARLRRTQGLRHGGGLRAAGRRADRQRHLAPARPTAARRRQRHVHHRDRPGASSARRRASSAKRWLSSTGSSSPPGARLRRRADRRRPGARARRKRRHEGIAVDDQTWHEIVAAADKVGASVE